MSGPIQLTHELRLPRGVALRQDEEWCEVVIDGEARRIRFHDYAQVFAIPGLYEHLFHKELCCVSPRVACAMLDEVLTARQVKPSSLRILDVGAGNGMVAETLTELGVTELVGVDVLPEAAMAAHRDRPGLYHDYHVADLANPPAEVRDRLATARFDCVTMVGALGFDDLSPRAFAEAVSYVRTAGCVTFNIKEEFLSAADQTGFGQLISRSFAEGALKLVAEQRYRHRFAVNGEPVYYVAYVAEKSTELVHDRIGS